MLSIIREGGTLTTNRFGSLLDSYLENLYLVHCLFFSPLCFPLANLVSDHIHWRLFCKGRIISRKGLSIIDFSSAL